MPNNLPDMVAVCAPSTFESESLADLALATVACAERLDSTESLITVLNFLSDKISKDFLKKVTEAMSQPDCFYCFFDEHSRCISLDCNCCQGGKRVS